MRLNTFKNAGIINKYTFHKLLKKIKTFGRPRDRNFAPDYLFSGGGGESFEIELPQVSAFL